MKIDPKRGDYIAKRCDMLSNDQLKNCERQLSLSWELFWSKIRCHKRCEETVHLVSDVWTRLNTYDGITFIKSPKVLKRHFTPLIRLIRSSTPCSKFIFSNEKKILGFCLGLNFVSDWICLGPNFVSDYIPQLYFVCNHLINYAVVFLQTRWVVKFSVGPDPFWWVTATLFFGLRLTAILVASSVPEFFCDFHIMISQVYLNIKGYILYWCVKLESQVKSRRKPQRFYRILSYL